MKVSVLIPCRNPGAHIVAAVRSAKAQPQTGEILVGDAGSSDGSIALARDLGATIVELGDHGQAAARNELARRAQCRWIQWLDADDYLLPGKFDAQLAAMLEADVGCSYCDFEILTEGDRERRDLSRHSPLSWARLGSPIQIGCYLTDTELARSVLFDPEFDAGGNNAKWALDLARTTAEPIHVPVLGCAWRRSWSPAQTTADAAAAMEGSDRFRRALNAYGMESPASPTAAPKLEMS